VTKDPAIDWNSIADQLAAIVEAHFK